MTEMPLWIHRTVLLCLPLIVAWFGLSFVSAALLIVLMILWRWLITLKGLIRPAKNQPEMVLSTISASHFVEKVRWCMDRLGLQYTERPAGGTLGVFLLGRTVPVLRFKTGLVYSNIGNSAEILAYLWGRYAASMPAAAAFLEPSTERRELENELDQYGVRLQVWVYYHILPDRQLTLQAWGANDPSLPRYQRLMLRSCFPVQKFLIRKAFRISPIAYAKAVEQIESLLAKTEASLGKGQKSLLGGQRINYTDMSFAALSGLWLQPDLYGGGKASGVKVELRQAPMEMQSDVQRWIDRYPRSVEFIRDVYRSRLRSPGDGIEG